MPDTPRAGLRRPEDADPFNIAADQRQNVDILDKAAFDSQGTFALRPLATAVKSGTYFFATDTGVTYRSDGTVWSVVGKRPALDVTATELGDEIVNEEKLTDGVLTKLGLTDTEAVRRGAVSTTAEESTASTSYTTLATADRLTNVVLPANGLIFVTFRALWRGTHATGASTFGGLTLFLNTDQIKQTTFNGAPSALAGTLNTKASTTSSGDGFISSPVTANDADGSSTIDTTLVSTGTTENAPMVIGAAAGTYTVSVQFKASSGCTVYVKERVLRVWTTGF